MRPLLKTSHQAQPLPVSGSALPAQLVAALGLAIMACSPAAEFSPEPRQEHAAVRLAEATTLATSGWNPAAPMNQPRQFHTATLLKDGSLLAVGGWAESTGVSSSAELYDPATQTWSMTGSLSVARREHTATLLPDGKVLVVGGYDSSYVTNLSSEVYDPLTRTWSLTSAPTQARRNHTATALHDGKVLVVGGYADSQGGSYVPLASYEVYDPATQMWSAAGSLHRGYASHTATLLPDGKVFIMGDDSNLHPPSEVYDPATGTSSLTSLSAHPRSLHTATLLPNGTVLVVGERFTDVYDPATNTWSEAGLLSEYRTKHTATLLSNGTVLVAGGGRYTKEVGWLPLDHTEVYDPLTRRWFVGPRLAERRSNHSATLLKAGQVLITGGRTLVVYGLSSGELFTPSEDMVPPETRIDSAPEPETRLAVPSFSFSSTEPGSTFECSLDEAAFSACPDVFPALEDGSHQLAVRARDTAGNADDTSAQHSWTVDTVPPGAPVLLEPTAGQELFTRQPLFSGTAEPGASVTLLIDGIEAGSAQADEQGAWRSVPTSALSWGAHRASAQAKDRAGNTSALLPEIPFSTSQRGNDVSGCSCSPSSWQASGPWVLLLLGLLRLRSRPLR
jgi:hypothetical protein